MPTAAQGNTKQKRAPKGVLVLIAFFICFTTRNSPDQIAAIWPFPVIVHTWVRFPYAPVIVVKLLPVYMYEMQDHVGKRTLNRQIKQACYFLIKSTRKYGDGVGVLWKSTLIS